MRVLALIVFLDIAAFAILLPPIMFVLENMGAGPAYATFIVATYSIGQFLSGPFWGNLSDRIGRKPVMIISILGAFLGFLILIFAKTPEMVLVSRALAGIMAGKTATAYASITDMTQDDRRARGMGVLGAAYGIGFVVGPGIGAWLGGGTPETADIIQPALASCGFSVAALVVCVLFFKESLPREARSATKRISRAAAFKRVAGNPVLLRFCFYIFVIATGMALIEPSTPFLIGERYGWGPRDFGMILVAAGLVSTFVQGGLIGPIVGKIGELNMVSLALVFIIIGMVIIIITPAAAGVVVGVIVIAVGVALFTTGMSALASLHAGTNERGLYMGVLQSMRSLGRAIGPVFAGALFSVWSGLPYLLGAGFALCVLFAIRRTRINMCAPAQQNAQENTPTQACPHFKT